MIDVLITSSSRSEYLKRVIFSLRDHLKYSGNLNFILHDDIRNNDSYYVLSLAKIWRINKTLLTRPAEGESKAIQTLLNHSTTKYVVFWEDDWLLLKDIDLDDVISFFEYRDDVNMIAFNKGLNNPYHGYKETVINGKKLLFCYDWVVAPSVWRADYIKPRFKVTENPDDIRRVLRGWKQRSPEWVKENMGTYFYGGYGQGEFIKHIGEKSANETI